MSYHGKLQTLKNGTADAEIQQWAYQQIGKEMVELTDEEIDYCWSHSHGNTPWMKQKAFARAIFLKVQEK